MFDDASPYAIFAAGVAAIILLIVSRKWHGLVFSWSHDRTNQTVRRALSKLGEVDHERDEDGSTWRVVDAGVMVHVFTKYAEATIVRQTERNITRVIMVARVPLDLEIHQIDVDPLLLEEGVDDGLPGNVSLRADPATAAVKRDEAVDEAIASAIGNHGAVLRAGQLEWSTEGLPSRDLEKVVAACSSLVRALEQQPWPDDALL